MSSILPPRPFLDALALRVAFLWLFLRAAAGVGSLAIQAPYPSSIVGVLFGAGWVTAAVLIVMRVEMWRRSETLFLANLGYSFTHLGALAALECAVFETGLSVLLA